MPTKLGGTSRVPSGYPGGMREFRLRGYHQEDRGHQQYGAPQCELESPAGGLQPHPGTRPGSRTHPHVARNHQVRSQQKTTGTVAPEHAHASTLVECSTQQPAPAPAHDPCRSSPPSSTSSTTTARHEPPSQLHPTTPTPTDGYGTSSPPIRTLKSFCLNMNQDFLNSHDCKIVIIFIYLVSVLCSTLV